MENNGQIQGVIKFLTKLTHTVDMFNFKFINVEVEDFNYISHSTFSSKICDFVSGND